MQETSLGSLGTAIRLLGHVYIRRPGLDQGSWPLLRELLAPALEKCSAAYLPAENLVDPGSGTALDTVLSEMVAAGIANSPLSPSLSFAHFVLGTSVHLMLSW